MHIRIISGLAAVCLLLVSCVSDLPIDTEDTDIPVINCILTNDTIQHLRLTRSVKITDGYVFKEIKEAQIRLFADGEPAGEFERQSYGNWQLRYQPVAGTDYQLSVRLPDGKEIAASTTMPEKTHIERENEKDRYPSKYFRQRTSDCPSWAFVLSVDEVPADLVHPAPANNAVLNVLLGTDHPLVDRFNEDGNLSDLVSTASTPAYSYYVRIQPAAVPEEGIPFCLQTNYGYYTFVYFRTVSKEYDQYLKSSLLKMFVYRSEDDPIQWFDENKVYSNITGGVGIFAAYRDDYFFYLDDNSFFR